MTTRFLVPTTWNTSKHYNDLFKLWDQISKLPFEENLNIEIELDFRDCKFLSHNGVSFLGGIAHFIEAQGGKVVFMWDTLDRKIYTNLAQNGFLNCFGEDQESWDGNSIPYRRDFKANTPSIMDYLLKQWLGKGGLKLNISSDLQYDIAGAVWEIYDNAFTHSLSKIGIFSCGQYYPNKEYLELSVIDFGIGIPTKVKSLPKNSHFSSKEALEWSLLSGTTTVVGGVSRGLGLNVLQEFVKDHRFTLRIFSNDTYVKIENNTVKYECDREVNFLGTLINISLRFG